MPLISCPRLSAQLLPLNAKLRTQVRPRKYFSVISRLLAVNGVAGCQNSHFGDKSTVDFTTSLKKMHKKLQIVSSSIPQRRDVLCWCTMQFQRRDDIHTNKRKKLSLL